MQENNQINQSSNKKFIKEDAYKTLERTISFNSNCDSKATTLLTIYGVLITVSLTSDGVTTIKSIIKSASSNLCFGNFVYIALFGLSVLGFIYGIIHIMLVLLSKTHCEEDSEEGIESDSVIYFGHISNSRSNPSYEVYKSKVMKRTEDDILNDIISQIYLNSKICSNKFKNYKRGFLTSIISLFIIITMWLIGYLIY